MMRMRNTLTIAAAGLVVLAACNSGRFGAEAKPEATAEAGGGSVEHPLLAADEIWVIGQDVLGAPRMEAERSGFAAFDLHEALAVPQTDPLYLDDDAGDVGDLVPNQSVQQHDDRIVLGDVPGCGGLVAQLEARRVVVPLEHTDARAEVNGEVASVRVAQRFTNPFDRKIEASYVFPLPHDSAVSDFLMVIGDRRIRGIIREREEAERIYAAARAQGYVASLLTQERPNVFTQKVANIEPGKAIDVEITYFHAVPQSDGWYELVFPMVVGPRFNPPGSTEGIGAVTLASAGSSGQATEVPYLRPEERSGHDISLSVAIDAGVAIEELECDSHAIEREETPGGGASVRLAEHDSIPNKDFVLRWRVAGDRIKTAFLSHTEGDEGWFTLVLHPPADLSSLPREALEMIFVVDCSGSMSGEPMTLVKRALRDALDRLEPTDTFQIIRFSNESASLAGAPRRATAENVRDGRRYVDRLEANGGTMMMHGIQAALRHPSDGERRRIITFMTDGFIGNEEEILREVKRNVGDARIFSFGVGSSPNRFLLEALAREGQGVAAYFGLADDPAEEMRHLYARVSRPALSDIELDWGGLAVRDVFPREIPDLFVGRPVRLTGRFRAPAGFERDTTVRAFGRVGGGVSEVAVTARDAAAKREALPKIWARSKIADLTSHARGLDDEDEIEQCGKDVEKVALEYGLMSAFTAFVAVDSATRTEGGEPDAVSVPVRVPEGTKFETTVGDG